MTAVLESANKIVLPSLLTQEGGGAANVHRAGTRRYYRVGAVTARKLGIAARSASGVPVARAGNHAEAGSTAHAATDGTQTFARSIHRPSPV